MSNNEITTFLSSQLSSFKTFLSTSPYVKGLTSNEVNKEIALHNTRMLKVVSDFNKNKEKQNKNQNQNSTPVSPGFAGWGEWDDSNSGDRDDNPFRGKGGGYGKERGGRNLFASHLPNGFGRKGKAKGYVRAGASTLFKSSGSSGGGGFERRIFGYGNGFDDDSSMGSVDEEEETPSKRQQNGNGKGNREKWSGWNGEGKRTEKMNREGEGEKEVVLLDSSESEGDADRHDMSVTSTVARGGRGGTTSEMESGGENDNVVTDKANSAHQKRIDWIMEMTGRKRKAEGEEDGEGMADHVEKEKEVKRGRGRLREIEILE
jgi:hypothetical protein